MLKEIPEKIVLMKKGESNCRWFRDDFFDLFIWYNTEIEYLSFHLYYDIYNNQRSLFWSKQDGFSHHFVDKGHSKPGKSKAAPIIMKNGEILVSEIGKKFQTRSKTIDKAVSSFVMNKLMEYLDLAI